MVRRRDKKKDQNEREKGREIWAISQEPQRVKGNKRKIALFSKARERGGRESA